MEKIYNRTWRDRFGAEVSAHLLKYLKMLGIEYEEQTNSYCFNGEKLKESYFEEGMFISRGGCEDDGWDDVCFNSNETSSTVGEITREGNVCFYGNQGMERKMVSYTEKDRSYQVEYTPGNREKDYSYCLVVSQDLLGNVMIAFGLIDNEIINVGEVNGTASDYLATLKARIKRKIGNDKMWPMIELLFDDPRIKEKLNEFIQNMASDIDKSFEQKVTALYAQYCTDAVQGMTKLADKFMADLKALERRRDECKKIDKSNGR